ncbi:MAG: serine/threonine-protein phosphatase, partial [Gemmatimonadota bacterium]|nr:serine/threonine-protein phosphatase [Gemmatimonadota bacterium]
EDGYAETSVSWQAGQDLLFLFTDGLSDGLGEGEIAGNRHLLEEVTDHRDLPTPELLERLFQIGDVAGAPQPDDRTAVLVRI